MSLAAYFDESGTDGQTSPKLVVAGFASDVEQWDRFKHEWDLILQEFNVPWFKAKEFNDGRRGYGPYKGWSDSKRKEYENRLMGVVRRRIFKSFATTLSKSAYDSIISPDPHLKKYFYSAYVFGGINCRKQVCDWRNELYPNTPARCIFDSGHKNEGQLLKVGKESRSALCLDIGVDVGDDRVKEFCPLQAGDWLSFELCHETRTVAKKSGGTSRDALVNFYDLPHEWLAIDETSINDYISRFVP